MSPQTPQSRFVGTIPETYDTYLGPLLFEFSAKDLARRVAPLVGSGARVLEVACGTGISTQYLREALPETVTIHATDLNQAMLDYAKKKRSHLPAVEFRQADALALPFEDDSFDAVVCQFGVMFFPDRQRGFEEMARVLKPGQPLAFNVWDSLARNPGPRIAAEVIASFFESDPPRFLETPFGFYDKSLIVTLLEAAGLRDIEHHDVEETVRQGDALGPARGMVEGNPGILEIQERASADSTTIVEAVRQRLEEAFGPAPLAIPLREIVFIARAA